MMGKFVDLWHESWPFLLMLAIIGGLLGVLIGTFAPRGDFMLDCTRTVSADNPDWTKYGVNNYCAREWSNRE